MRGGVLFIGIVLLLAGSIFGIQYYNDYAGLQNYNVGNVAYTLSSSYRSALLQAEILTVVFVVMALIGLVLLIAGAITNPAPKMSSVDDKTYIPMGKKDILTSYNKKLDSLKRDFIAGKLDNKSFEREKHLLTLNTELLLGQITKEDYEEYKSRLV